MRNKTNGISSNKSNNQLPKSKKNVLASQMNSKNRNNLSRKIIAVQPYYADKRDCKRVEIEREENWVDTEIDDELEVADIDESDFQFLRNKFE